jgi:hypothetical protein
VEDIHVDILAHRYKLLEKPEDIQGIKALSTPDIIAMKLNAISASGQRSKDFIDVFYLLNHFPLPAMLGFYEQKYNQKNTSHVLKSLIYYDDVDLADWPVLIKDPKLNWAQVRKKIERVVLKYAHSGK